MNRVVTFAAVVALIAVAIGCRSGTSMFGRRGDSCGSSCGASGPQTYSWQTQGQGYSSTPGPATIYGTPQSTPSEYVVPQSPEIQQSTVDPSGTSLPMNTIPQGSASNPGEIYSHVVEDRIQRPGEKLPSPQSSQTLPVSAK